MADEERSQNHESLHANASNMSVACDSRSACSALEHSIANPPGVKVTAPSNGYIKHNCDEGKLGQHAVKENPSTFGRGDGSHNSNTPESDSQSIEPITTADVSFIENDARQIETNCKVDSDSIHNCCGHTEQCGAATAVDGIIDQLSCTSLSESQTKPASKDVRLGIEYVVYESELQMPDIMKLITKDLSEPYSIYTYRYFIHNWPKLCFLASIPFALCSM